MTSDRLRICVFGGARADLRGVYLEAARRVGQRLAELDIAMVFGGISGGVLGSAAAAASKAGGEVCGVVSQVFVDGGIAYEGEASIEIVPDISVRKERMLELSDAFICLPGGLGTWEELSQVLSWKSIGLHAKPVGVLNVDNYFDGLLSWLDRSVQDGLVLPCAREELLVHADCDQLLTSILDGIRSSREHSV